MRPYRISCGRHRRRAVREKCLTAGPLERGLGDTTLRKSGQRSKKRNEHESSTNQPAGDDPGTANAAPTFKAALRCSVTTPTLNAWRVRMKPRLGLGDCSNRNLHARNAYRHFGTLSSWRIGRKPLRPLFVHSRKVSFLEDDDGRANYPRQR